MKIKTIGSIILFSLPAVQAADLFIDISAGNQNWDTSTNNWFQEAGLINPDIWENGDTANVSNTSGSNKDLLLQEDITASGLNHTGTGGLRIEDNGVAKTLTVNGSITGTQNIILQNGVTLTGNINLNKTSGNLAFNNGSSTNSGSIFNVGSTSRLQYNGTSSANSASVTLAGGSLALRFTNGSTNTLAIVGGDGSLINNRNSNGDVATVVINQLQLGTDGTIGTISASGSTGGNYNLELASGFTSQFDLNNSAGVLTNDFLDLGSDLFNLDVDGHTIALNLTGDALESGASFQLANNNDAITGTATFDTSNAMLADGLSWDFSQFNATGTISVIPEPGSAALLGLAGFAFVLRRRK
ncbi:PEP-CTERM sorting domain-containing protein [Persicirhabdus sediminis]|uniref:PEP-CTERM sorting domain-containing protein n=1 Tax=Persicirhabdus sediminis TaxID=454144 RepID=A0A8J7MEI2_9BACT|nr:PEP-CTERM sorting domain-containing protein [Persicirhabdus sediminis]MBK1791053.1 PEP-CTERM sorting domain-containing protein [Persicirhabdus sediminis]